MDTCQSVVFTGPRCVEVHSERMPEPGAGEALVRSLVSAISPGTECLIYTGQFPQDMKTDESIAALGGKLEYPLKYGYSTVGEVTAVGPGVGEEWIGRRVFAFNPHESHFTMAVESLQTVPEGMAPEEAVFLPNMETAVNFVMDGRPMIGERAAVLGQGIVGLLTTALLGYFPLAALVTFDRIERRRQAALDLGATASLDPMAAGREAVRELLGEGADLCYELSGKPEVLDFAIEITRFDGRIIVIVMVENQLELGLLGGQPRRHHSLNSKMIHH